MTSRTPGQTSDGGRRIEGALKSIPAPPESDSDEDFKAGAYIDESPKKARKSTGGAGRKRGRRSDALESIIDTRRKKVKREHVPSSHNPLLEFFGDTLAFDTEISDADGDGDDEFDEKEIASDPEDDEDGIDRANSSPIILKAVMPSPTLSDIPDITMGAPEQLSETEPESEVETSVVPLKPDPGRGQPGHEMISHTESETEPESRTEPESDQSTTIATQSEQLSGKVPPKPTTDDDSVTESESELDDYVDLPQTASGLVAHSGTPQSPFILDAGHGIRVPSSLNNCLREYQRDGVRFFFERYVLNRGAVLGDDMGLGKTIQVISFLSALMRKSGTKADTDRRRKHVSRLQDSKQWKKHRRLPPADATWPTALIVVPSSVTGVWAREFNKWGYFEVGVYMGTRQEREQVLSDFKLGRLDVVVTGFETARGSIDLISSLPWTVLIVDEAHRLKNPKSQSTLAFSSFSWPEDHPTPAHITQLISSHSYLNPTTPQSKTGEVSTVEPRTGPIRIALTGTAIQNTYFELWTLLNWANPGSVGTVSQWKKCVADPLTAGQSKGCKEEERLLANSTAQNLRDRLLPRFFLRRTKDIIKDQLPKKTDEVVFCPLSPTQIKVYNRILKVDAVVNMVRKEEKCDCGSGKKYDGVVKLRTRAYGDLFKYMSALIKISNHLALILPAPTDTPEQTLRNRDLTDVGFPNHTEPKYGSAVMQAQYCGKWMVLETLLKEWRKDLSNKVLIFTKSVKLLQMLEFHLGSQNYSFVKLDGSVKHDDRMDIIDAFQDDPNMFIFLISTLAGGTGLNLTAANKVVVFDPNWNPAHDLQAMDRAYRFGQTRDVSVYRLLGAGSIEELIYARQVYKQQQMAIGYEASIQTRYFSGVSGDKSKQGELFGLQNIFKLHEQSSTKIAIERANMTELDWALAHMDSKKTRRKSGTAEDWVYEAEIKENQEDADLKGLGALLLDDSVPEVLEDDVTKILGSYGIKYSHRNDDIIAPSRIEEERMKTVLEEKRKQAKKARSSKKQKDGPAKSPEPQWPPKRRHHKPPPSPKSKLVQRQKALIELGMIQTPTDLPKFALNFAKKSPDEQNQILAQLDEHREGRS